MVGVIADSTVTLADDADVSAMTAWTEGHLDFKREPIANVLATLERWYGVRFQVADSAVLAGTVTGRLDFQRTSAALNTLKSLLGVDMSFDRRGDTTIVTLRTRVDGRAATRERPDVRHTFTYPGEVGR
jgi:ferric-dicitrate binding protein FerR (iron transport regulator)